MKTFAIIFALTLYLCNSQRAPTGYTQVPTADVQNSSVIQSLAQTGSNAIIQVALADGNLPNDDTNFTIASINSVYQQNGLNYWLSVTLKNQNNGVILNSNFIIYYNSANGVQRLLSATYKIPPHAPVTPTAAADSSNNTDSRFTLIPPDQVQNSSTIQYLASVGANYVIQQVIDSGKLPTANTDLSISNINSVSQIAVNGNGINYRFNVTLNNSDGVVVNANYLINYDPANNVTTVRSASYLINPFNYAPGKAPKPTNSIVVPAPVVSVSVSANTNVSGNSAANSSQPKPAVAGGYTPLSPDQYQNNGVIQNLAALGAQSVAQQAIADGNLPSNSVLKVSKINSVAAQVVNGMNYNFNVILNNADSSITVLADYIVYYQSWTHTSKVTASSYAVEPKNFH